jgi:DNA/RNA-binding domain of Phe-tRNA-synthetase-like protein
MKNTVLTIEGGILSKYPEVAIGYIVVDNLHHVASAKISEDLKNLPAKGISENELNLQNMVEHPTIKVWRNTYQECGVKPKTFKSSVESLLRRFVQNDYKTIIPIVDLYNYVSAGFLLPVGGYDLQKIEGKMTLRFGKSEDRFIALNGKEDITVNSEHIVYADENVEAPVICWMWNHKDSRRTMLTNEVTKGLFIFDCIASEDRIRMTEAQKHFEKNLISLGATVIYKGILDKECPAVSL